MRRKAAREEARERAGRRGRPAVWLLALLAVAWWAVARGADVREPLPLDAPLEAESLRLAPLLVTTLDPEAYLGRPAEGVEGEGGRAAPPASRAGDAPDSGAVLFIPRSLDLYPSYHTFLTVERIRFLAREALTRYRTVLGSDTGREMLRGLFAARCEENEFERVARQILAEREAGGPGLPGLRLGGGYRYNTSGHAANQHRATLGFTFDLLDEGYLKERSRREIAARELEIRRLTEEISDLQAQLQCRDHILIKYFDILKRDILAQRQELLEEYYHLLRQDYFAGAILLDDLLRVEYELNENRERIAAYESLVHVTGEEMFPFNLHQHPPYYKIDLPALLAAIDADPRYERVAAAREEIVDERYNRLLDTELELYATPAYHEKYSGAEYANTQMGLRFTVPLWSRSERERELEHLKARLEQRKLRRFRHLEARRLFNSYGEKYKDAIEMEYKRQIAAERLRRDLLELQRNPTMENSRQALFHLIELEDVAFEAVSVQEGLYRRILHLLSVTGVGYREGFLQPADILKGLDRSRSGHRSLYVWSQTFNGHANEFLLDLMETKAVDRAIVSFGARTDRAKLERFVREAERRGLEVSLMASATEWLDPDRRDRLRRFLERARPLTPLVHLDIEPQVRPDYRERKAALWRQYREMLQAAVAAKRWDQQIGISVPLHLDEADIEALGRLADRMYVMAYGITDPVRLKHRLAPFLRPMRATVVVALRPDDFASELDMERFIQHLLNIAPIQDVALHDCEGLLNILEP